MIAEHAPISPSSGDQIMQCPGSVRMQVLYPESDDSDEAREGTAAHWVLAEMCSGRAVAVGQVTPAGFVVTDEMVQGAEVGLRWVHRVCARHPGEQPQFFIECKAPARRIHDQCWGTYDLGIWFPVSRHLYGADYKFGHGWVEVFENWQLVAYLCAMMEQHNILGDADQVTKFTACIIQPRSYHPDGPVREWSGTLSDLRPLINQWSFAADDAMGPDPQLRAGLACEHCSAKLHCPASLQAGLQAIDKSRSAVPLDLTAHGAGVELMAIDRAIKALESRRTGLAAQIEGMITRGERVPHWSIQREPGRLKWKMPDAQVIVMGNMLGHNLAKPPAAITPTQAKELVPESVVAQLADRPTSSSKLVQVTDADARKIFAVDGAVN